MEEEWVSLRSFPPKEAIVAVVLNDIVSFVYFLFFQNELLMKEELINGKGRGGCLGIYSQNDVLGFRTPQSVGGALD